MPKVSLDLLELVLDTPVPWCPSAFNKSKLLSSLISLTSFWFCNRDACWSLWEVAFRVIVLTLVSCSCFSGELDEYVPGWTSSVSSDVFAPAAFPCCRVFLVCSTFTPDSRLLLTMWKCCSVLWFLICYSNYSLCSSIPWGSHPNKVQSKSRTFAKSSWDSPCLFASKITEKQLERFELNIQELLIKGQGTSDYIWWWLQLPEALSPLIFGRSKVGGANTRLRRNHQKPYSAFMLL